MEHRLTNLYFEWLSAQVGQTLETDPEKSYWFMLGKLHSEKFVARVSYDENRADDGLSLREEFVSMYENGPVNPAIFSEPCSMLEFFVALSRRYDFLIYDSATGDRTVECFWKMLHNLGLDGLTDEEYYPANGPDIVGETCARLVSRRYARDGSGGIFPLKRPKEDQRKVEIWYQMNAYILESS